MTTSDEYIKTLEKENETLRNRIEMNPTLADILKRYFCLTKEINRDGVVSYGLQLTPMANSNFLHEDDYNYLKKVGVHEEMVMGVADFQKNVTVTNDNNLVNELLDEFYRHNKISVDTVE
jgi:hypothetical protein